MFRVFLCIVMQHDWWLVVVAALVCVTSTFATFFLYSRVPTSPAWRRWIWLSMTGVVAGSGIWTTHFVAMLAFKTSLPTGFDALETLGSLGVAIVSTAAGFAVASGAAERRPRAKVAIGGLIVGLGITFMHYVGMAGYRTAGHLQWDGGFVLASVLVGAVFAAGALLVASTNADFRRLAMAAGLLSLGIIGMHFTGMTAVTILPDASVPVPASLMSEGAMVAAAVAVTALILIVAIGGVAFDSASRNGNLKRLREALDVMPEGLAFYDASDRLVAWNAQYADLGRISGAALRVGMPFAEILQTSVIHGAYPEAAGREAQWVAERTAARWSETASLTQRTPAGRWLRITERRTAEGGTVSVSVDITDLKVARDNAEELARRAEAAEAVAEEAAAVKAEFLANMSHELRTPLTSIIGFIGLAAEQPELSDLTRDYVGRVGNAGRALLCTVNDILDFSKLEAGQVTIHPEPVVLAKLCRATLDLFTPQAGAKDLSLTLDGGDAGDDLVVAVDPDRIRQILLNLVSNAVKFTTVGGVTLRTRYDEVAERLRIEVIDTGPGLTAEQQGRLFKRFSQIDGSLTRTQSGTGLGLAICKGLTEAMGGEIGIESQAGDGSLFWFEIPAAPAVLTESNSNSQGGEQISFTGLRVLVVDDNPANRELARLFLVGVGVEVSEAVNGEEAAQMAMEMPYDVILMDIQMPVLNGPGALRRIRDSRGPNDATPILAFTADATTQTRAHLTELGFDSVVEKPIDPRTLITAVGRATAFVEQLQESYHVA